MPRPSLDLRDPGVRRVLKAMGPAVVGVSAMQISILINTQLAAALGDDYADRKKQWGPAERARRWVMSEFPLLGALVPQITIIADRELCERMDISIAAVDGYLGEMYFNPAWSLTQDEWTFIFVHELLHVALLHHTRSRGRDPLIWNYACDFVINGWLVEMGVGHLPSIGALYVTWRTVYGERTHECGLADCAL